MLSATDPSGYNACPGGRASSKDCDINPVNPTHSNVTYVTTHEFWVIDIVLGTIGDFATMWGGRDNSLQVSRPASEGTHNSQRAEMAATPPPIPCPDTMTASDARLVTEQLTDVLGTAIQAGSTVTTRRAKTHPTPFSSSSTSKITRVGGFVGIGFGAANLGEGLANGNNWQAFWGGLDTSMGFVGLAPGGQAVAGPYFAARLGMGVVELAWEMSNIPPKGGSRSGCVP